MCDKKQPDPLLLATQKTYVLLISPTTVLKWEKFENPLTFDRGNATDVNPQFSSATDDVTPFDLHGDQCTQGKLLRESNVISLGCVDTSLRTRGIWVNGVL